MLVFHYHQTGIHVEYICQKGDSSFKKRALGYYECWCLELTRTCGILVKMQYNDTKQRQSRSGRLNTYICMLVSPVNDYSCNPAAMTAYQIVYISSYCTASILIQCNSTPSNAPRCRPIITVQCVITNRG